MSWGHGIKGDMGSEFFSLKTSVPSILMVLVVLRCFGAVFCFFLFIWLLFGGFNCPDLIIHSWKWKSGMVLKCIQFPSNTTTVYMEGICFVQKWIKILKIPLLMTSVVTSLTHFYINMCLLLLPSWWVCMLCVYISKCLNKRKVFLPFNPKLFRVNRHKDLKPLLCILA